MEERREEKEKEEEKEKKKERTNWRAAKNTATSNDGARP